MGLLVTLLGGSGQENTVRSTHTKYRTATKEYVPTTPIFYTNKITTFIPTIYNSILLIHALPCNSKLGYMWELIAILAS